MSTIRHYCYCRGPRDKRTRGGERRPCHSYHCLKGSPAVCPESPSPSLLSVPSLPGTHHTLHIGHSTLLLLILPSFLSQSLIIRLLRLLLFLLFSTTSQPPPLIHSWQREWRQHHGGLHLSRPAYDHTSPTCLLPSFLPVCLSASLLPACFPSFISSAALLSFLPLCLPFCPLPPSSLPPPRRYCPSC